MRTGNLSLRRVPLAVPLGVLGGAAIVTTALLWSRRRSNNEATRRRFADDGNADEEDSDELSGQRLSELEVTHVPDDGELGLDALDLGVDSDAPAGESYDTVNPEDAGREFLLRATETQSSPHKDPAEIVNRAAEAQDEEEEARDEWTERTVKVPPGFFGAADERVK